MTLFSRLCLWLRVGVSLLVLSPAVLAAGLVDHVVARDRLKTSIETFDASALQAADALPFKSVLAAGYGREPVWVRLRIDPGLTADRRTERLLLRLRPGYLDEVQLFDPASPVQPTGLTGDRHPLAGQAVPSAVFNLALAAGDEPRDIWLRVRSTSSRTASFEVLREQDLLAQDARYSLWSGVYVGSLLVFAAWGAAQVLVRRDALNLAFMGFQLASLALGACVLGFVRMLAAAGGWETAVDDITSLTVMAAVFTSMVFNTILLREMRAPRLGVWIMSGILMTYPLLTGLLLAGHGSRALQINMFVLLLMPLLSLVFALMSRGKGEGPLSTQSSAARRFGMGYFGASLALTTAAAMLGLGWMEAPVATLDVVLLHGIACGILMLGMLLNRNFHLLSQREQLAVEVEFSRQRIEQERAFHRDKESLLTMLAHELKTPLATIRMLLGSPGLPASTLRPAQSAVQDMNNVIERCLQVGQLDEGALRINWQCVDLAALVGPVVAASAHAERVALQVFNADLTVRADPQLLETVLRNLLENALKYSPSGSCVQVCLEAVGGAAGVALTVRNDVGPTGKPDPDRVFDKYYRHPQAQRKTGSGLGLYLVHGLAQRLQGQLAYQDEGQRVSFRLWLPRAPKGASV